MLLPDAMREPNAAFCMIVAGLLVIYLEFLRPGSVIFGVAGGVITLIGAAVLCDSGLRTSDVAICAVAVTLLLLMVRTHLPIWSWVFPAALLLWGVSRLPLHRWVAFPTTVVWLVITLWLLRVAEIARFQKTRVLPVIDP